MFEWWVISGSSVMSARSYCALSTVYITDQMVHLNTLYIGQTKYNTCGFI